MAAAIKAGAGDRHHPDAEQVFKQMAAKPPDVSVPAVSVIIPGWGAAAFLPEALASLQGQSRTDWEAIVVDDGDTEAVARAVAPFLSDPRIRLLATDNGGLAMARNRGITAARAERIALLDGDDRYRPDYLERMLSALDAAPDIGFVTCDAWLFGAPAFHGKLFSELQSQTGPLNLERVIRREFRVFGAATMRREALTAVGGYNGSLRSAEDLDLWIDFWKPAGAACGSMLPYTNIAVMPPHCRPAGCRSRAGSSKSTPMQSSASKGDRNRRPRVRCWQYRGTSCASRRACRLFWPATLGPA
jgi:glycosyltransferase involved in cell wall biosynthesis